MVALDVTSGPLTAAGADEVRRVADAALAADGVAPLSEQPLLWLTDPAAPVRHVLARSRDRAGDGAGELVGYAQVALGDGATSTSDVSGQDDSAGPGVSTELVTAPSARRTGIGTALLARARALAEEHRASSFGVWAHGDLPSARALAARAGLVPVRELWQMGLDLDAARPDAPHDLAAGVDVRAFVPGTDEERWLTLNARAFAHHPEQGRMTLADLRAREAEPWFDPAGLLLAERDGTLLASMWTKVHAPDAAHPEPVGEIYVLGVDPDAQGLGLGGALTSLALHHLAHAGLHHVILYTERENTAAVRTYTRAGFERTAVDVLHGVPPDAPHPPDIPGSPTSGTMQR